MAKPPQDKPVTAIEPTLIFIGAGLLGAIVLFALVTGWVWIPGSRHSRGAGHWINRSDSLTDYLVYISIMSIATLAFVAMAIDRLRRFNAQQARRYTGKR